MFLVYTYTDFILAQSVRARWPSGSCESVHANLCVRVEVRCKFASPLFPFLSLCCSGGTSWWTAIATAALRHCWTGKDSSTAFCVQTHWRVRHIMSDCSDFSDLLAVSPSDSTWMYVHPPCLGQRCSWREFSVSAFDAAGLSRPQKGCVRF